MKAQPALAVLTNAFLASAHCTDPRAGRPQYSYADARADPVDRQVPQLRRGGAVDELPEDQVLGGPVGPGPDPDGRRPAGAVLRARAGRPRAGDEGRPGRGEAHRCRQDAKRLAIPRGPRDGVHGNWPSAPTVVLISPPVYASRTISGSPMHALTPIRPTRQSSFHSPLCFLPFVFSPFTHLPFAPARVMANPGFL